MKPKVYIETSVISYLVAWRSPQLIMAANQEATRQWWDEQRHEFDLFVSAAVRDEAARGNADAVQKRMEVLDSLEELAVTEHAADIADQILRETLVPHKAAVDAMHIAIAAVNQMDYLLTWNCRHIANATLRRPLSQLLSANGLTTPIICTPAELIELEGDSND
ncbi:MAG: type II toxin-antitoxin system VapC family toxin [Planctomycetaceae bacterium]